MTDEFTIQGSAGVKIPNGLHYGLIVDVRKEIRGVENYEYLDVYISVDNLRDQAGKEAQIKYGCPFRLSTSSKLGKLLMKVGVPEADIVSGKPLNVKTILLGTKVQYMTLEKPGKTGGMYANVVEDSIAKI